MDFLNLDLAVAFFPYFTLQLLHLVHILAQVDLYLRQDLAETHLASFGCQNRPLDVEVVPSQDQIAVFHVRGHQLQSHPSSKVELV